MANDGTRTATNVPASAGDLTDAYDEIIDGMVGLASRWRGPGIDSSTSAGPKLIKRADAKDELDRICFLDGSALIASQGKVRTVKVMRDGSGADNPVAFFPVGSYTALPQGPGYGTRTDEYFVRWDWNEARQAFDAERHYLNATALDKLGGTGLYTTEQLDEETSKWVSSQTLADEVGDRIPNHFGNGLIVWSIKSHYWHPELELGDVVAIESTRFVARSPINSEQIRGRVSALAIVVRIGDPFGTDLDLWVPSFDKIVVATGDVTVAGINPFPQPPSLEITFNADGEAVVSASVVGPASNIYVTVGNGSAPSDPTAATNDGSISGTSGTVDTGVKITAGNVAFVKAIAADAAGTTSDVSQAQQARRVGPFHKDTTDRKHTSNDQVGAEDTFATVSIPANVLGTDGGADVELHLKSTLVFETGITLRVRFGGTLLVSIPVPAGTTYYYDINVQVVNDGATNAQDVRVRAMWDDGVSGSTAFTRTTRTTHSLDSTSAMSLTCTIDFAGGAGTGDFISLLRSYGKLLGAD